MKYCKKIIAFFLAVIISIAMMPTCVEAATKKPGIPTITKVTVSGQTVTVIFKKAKNAKSYRLYSATAKTKWKYWKTVKASKKKNYSNAKKYKLKKKGKKYKVYKKATAYSYKQLASGKKTKLSFKGSWNTSYKLAVRAYNDKKAGKYSKIKTAKIGSKPYIAPDYDSYETYVFFGSDSRANDTSWKSQNGGPITTDTTGTEEGVSRSDVIMLFNVDRNKHTIDIVSVFRDTALNEGTVSEPNIQNANRAYSDYGPIEACKVLERNLDVKIKGYAVANFKGVADVIDDLGGVTVDVENKETYPEVSERYHLYTVVDTANVYIDEMNGVYNEDTPHIEKPGTQKLTGFQAVAYARVRYTDPIFPKGTYAEDTGSDRTRTVRQKIVLEQMIEQYKKLPAAEKIDFLATHKNGIEIRFLDGSNKDPFGRMTELIGSVLSYRHIKSGFPYKWTAKYKLTPGENDGKTVMLVPMDLASNVTKLHNDVYLERWYSPNKTVKQNSNWIEKTSKEYTSN